MKYKKQLIKSESELKKVAYNYRSLMNEYSEESVIKAQAIHKDIMRPLIKRIGIIEQIISLESQLNEC